MNIRQPILSALLLATAALPAAVSFETEVKPIFEKHCMECHGPKKQKSDFRLDDREVALHGGESHAPNILPGKATESPLLKFVTTDDRDTRMPPKGDRLSAAEVDTLKRWIAEGAIWPESASLKKTDPLDWWSLKPLSKPALPSGEAPHPIDRFILAKLQEKNLQPSGVADARTILRRLNFDLIGLPPTAEELAAFEQEAAHDLPAAIGHAADRLLASPRYGERWGRHWLDVVHYGDTHGYDKDKLRPNAWPYRDYVIRAFNEDKPYARFVEEQLAGDTLYPQTADGHIAQGFISAGPWDYIGHAELPETKLDGKIARALDRDDMVSNTTGAFLATTSQCARCHNHKFDPIKQEDYYRLQAVFAALDRADKSFDIDPVVAKQRPPLVAERTRLDSEIKALNEKSASTDSRRVTLIGKIIDELKQGTAAVERPEYGYHSAISKEQSVTKWVQVDLGVARELTEVILTGCHDTFNNIGAGFGFPARYKVELSDDAKFTQGVTIIADLTGTDVLNPGVKPQRFPLAKLKGRYLRVTATKLALRKNDYILALAELQAIDPKGRNVALGANVTSLDSIEAGPRWGRLNLTDGYFYGLKSERDDARIALLERERTEIRKGAGKTDPATEKKLAELTAARANVAADISKLPAPQVAYVGTIHKGTGSFAGTGANGGKPRPIFVLKRGDVSSPDKEVGPGTLPFAKELTSQFNLTTAAPEGARRVALARWITDDRNPLTWRVIVNRVWHYHFGRGLSDTPNDFGRMGSQPTHPELLDWLAVDFRDNGQSLKQLHRLIVTSAIYRQSSLGHPANEKIDTSNAFLWRMNRRKLEAEAVNDSVLAVAGKLDLTMGGPGFQDFVIEKPQHSPHYEYDQHDVEDPKSHRRSVYRFIVRSQPQPFLTVLDCADPSMSVASRNETVNALQALAMRNNRLTVAMAKHFAARVAKDASTPLAQIDLAFRLALSRPPSANEAEAMSVYVREHGLTNLCRLIFNLNEFNFVD
jgi:mono/diheme cytochrome c family protein